MAIDANAVWKLKDAIVGLTGNGDNQSRTIARCVGIDKSGMPLMQVIGSNIITPLNGTQLSKISVGDEVEVIVENGAMSAVGNITSPSVGAEYVGEALEPVNASVDELNAISERNRQEIELNRVQLENAREGLSQVIQDASDLGDALDNLEDNVIPTLATKTTTDSLGNRIQTIEADYATGSELSNYTTTTVYQQGISGLSQTIASNYNSLSGTISQVSGDLEDYKDSNDEAVAGLQSQLDGQIEAWYYSVDPTTSNAPASSWTTNAEKERHVGDLYYNVSNGHSWRWMKSGSTYKWQQIPDSDAAAALAAAQDAQATADGKRRIFTSTPVAPYDVGDLWVTGSVVKYATQLRTGDGTANGSYHEEDWSLTATDDTLAASAKSIAEQNAQDILQAQQDILDNKTLAQAAQSAADAVGSDLTSYKGTVSTTYHTISDYNADQQQFRTAIGETYSTKTELSAVGTTATNALNTANKNVKSTTMLWFTKANTTAPNPPTQHVTSSSTAGNAWRTVVPVYNASYPYYYYCYEYLLADGTYSWSPVTYDRGTTEAQSVGRGAQTAAAAAQTAADNAQADITSYKATVSNTYSTKTELNQTKDAIELAASQTYGTKTEVTTVQNNLDAYKQTVEQNYSTKAELKVERDRITSTVGEVDEVKSSLETVSNPNLSPYFSHPFSDFYNATDNPDGYWHQDYTTYYWTQLTDGWAHCECTSGSSTTWSNYYVHPIPDGLKPSTKYTFLVEWRNATIVGNAVTIAVVTDFTSELDCFTGGTKNTGAITTSEGSKHITVETLSDLSQAVLFSRGYVSCGANCSFVGDIRISIYEGEYDGPYKPYVDQTLSMRMSSAETSITQNATDITLRATKEESYQMGQPNLVPWFSAGVPQLPSTYWKYGAGSAASMIQMTDMGDGWCRMVIDNSAGTGVVRYDYDPVAAEGIKLGKDYTFLFEFRNISQSTGTNTQVYAVQASDYGMQFWGNNAQKVLQGNGVSCTTYLDQTIAQSGGHYAVLCDDGVYRKRIVRKSEASDSQYWTRSDDKRCVRLVAYCGAGGIFDAEFRFSIYEGEYTGPYKPYSGTKLYASQAELKVANDNINLRVEKNDVINQINLSTEGATISASKVNIEGAAIFTSGRLSDSALASVRLTLTRDNWTDAGWAVYEVIGKADNWKNYHVAKGGTTSATGFVSDTLRVGDLVVIEGVSTDTGNTHRVTVKVTQVPSGAGSDIPATTVNAVNSNGIADNIHVGGSNLLLNTSDQWSEWMTPTANTNNIVKYWFMTKNGELSTWASIGQDVSCSFEIEFSGVTASTSGSFRVYSQDCFCSVANGTLNGSNKSGWNDGAAIRGGNAMNYTTAPADGVYQFKNTVAFAANHTSQYALVFSIRCDYWGSGKYRIRKVKYELGNKPTDWSPAPEDVAASAVNRTQRVYYRTTANASKPSAPTSAWVEQSGDVRNSWTAKVPRLTENADGSGTKYPALYTCEQYQMGDGRIGCTPVLLDDSQTVIDGGKIITGSVSANSINASSGTFNTANIPNLSAAKITSGDIAADRIKANVISAINSLSAGTINGERVNASQLTIGGSYLATQTDVDNVQVGVTNLLPQTQDWSGANKRTNGTYTVTSDTYGGCSVMTQVWGSGNCDLGYESNVWTQPLEADTWYTLSFWAKASANVDLHSYLFSPSVVDKSVNSSGRTATSADGAILNSITTSWQRIWVSWHIKANATSLPTQLIVTRLQSTHSGVTAYVAGAKLEKGNKASNWSPAPEDQTAYVDSSVNGIQVGGRNLLRGTSTMTAGDGRWDTTQTFRASGGTLSNVTTTGLPIPSVSGSLRITNTGSSAVQIGFAQDYVKGIVAGETYTQGAWVRASTTMNVFHQPIYKSNTQLINGNPVSIGTDWTYITYTGVLSGAQATDYYNAGYMYAQNVPANGWFEVCGLKLEKGDKATDWTPAQEDIDSSISGASKTATTYLTDIAGGGVMVHPSGDDTSGWKIADALELLKSGVSHFKAWIDNNVAKVRIGLESGNHIMIDDDSVDIYKSGISVASFGVDDDFGSSGRLTIGYRAGSTSADSYVNITDVGSESTVSASAITMGKTLALEATSRSTSGRNRIAIESDNDPSALIFKAQRGSRSSDTFTSLATLDGSGNLVIAGGITLGTALTAAQIPSLAASKITSGTFAAGRIPNLDATKITSGTLNAARLPAATATAKGGVVLPTVLYEGTAKGDFTLSATAANFTRLRVYFTANNGGKGSTDIYDPDGSKFTCETTCFANSTTMQHEFAQWSISGTSVTWQNAGYLNLATGSSVSGSVTKLTSTTNQITINRVEGWQW